MRKLSILLTGAAVLALAACGDRSKTEDGSDAVSEAAEEENAGLSSRQIAEKHAAENLSASLKFLKENAAREGIVTTDSGLQYEVLEEGPEDGVTPVSTDLVVVHYVGTLTDGIEFDSSRARGAASSFRLNTVIPGWTEGLQLMSEGDRYRFFVPPDLAYGENPRPGVIKPNDALIFDVELIKVHDAERNLQAATKFLEDNAKKEGVTTLESGLQYEVLSEGDADGSQPTSDSTVVIDFSASLVDGSEFDSSYVRGAPAEFMLGKIQDKWSLEALTLMSKGDKYRFFIPPALAYGEGGTPGGPIGPNEALIFEVELLDVK